MNQSLSSKALFQIALKHFALIDNAYFEQGGQIIVNDDNQKQVNALLKHRLAWQFEDMPNAQLSGPVLKLLSKLGNDKQRRQGSEQIAGLWQELREKLEEYQLYTKKQRTQQLQTLAQDMHEIAFEMMEVINNKLTTFARYIDQEFSTVSDIELRLLHNRRAIKEAEQLNQLMQSCDSNEFASQTRQDASLRKLFNLFLPQSLSLCRKELVRVLHDLRKLVTKLQADSELSSKLIRFRQHLAQNPNFIATPVSFVDKVPPILSQTSASKHIAYPDIYNDDHSDSIAQAISQIKRQQQSKINDAPKLDIQTEPEIAQSQQDISELYSKSLAVIQVAQSGQKIRASQAYQQLKVNSDYRHWLLALLNTLSGLEKAQRNALSIQINTTDNPLFNGNLEVADIQLDSK